MYSEIPKLKGFSEYDLLLFGSSTTGLIKQGSDLDLTIVFDVVKNGSSSGHKKLLDDTWDVLKKH